MSIDWNTLRQPHNQSFEELCCQLALKEPASIGSRFVRKGAPDAGLECYWIRPDGTEVGWQAKFFRTSPTDSQWSQLDESVKNALDKHSALTHLIICLPHNLPDARRPNQESARQKWDKRVTKWQEWVGDSERKVRFELWDESALVARISQEHHRGTYWFWFGTAALTDSWLREQIQLSIKNSGARYSPELHIDTEQQLQFDAMGRTRTFHDQIAGLYTSLRVEARPFLRTSDCDSVRAEFDILQKGLVNALHSLEAWAMADLSTATWWHTEQMPWHESELQTDLLEENIYACRRKIESCREQRRREKGEKHEPGQYVPSDEFTTVTDNLHRLQKAVHELQGFCANLESMLCNTPYMLLIGEAGQGKTHRLCDVARRRSDLTYPTVLLLGEQFHDDEPWGQIIRFLGLNCSTEEFIGGLEAAAIAYRSRALILIDALNEGDGNRLWKKWLPGFVERIKKSPWIGLCVTVRDSYERHVLPLDALGNDLIRVEHQGFGEFAYAAAVKFFAHFGIEPSQPLLLPEFENPLFLKLFCTGLRNTGQRRMPAGLRGITKIFEFYLSSIDRKLSQPSILDYDARRELVTKAVHLLADAMAEAVEWSLPLNMAREIVDDVLPTSGYERSLFRHLESEGLIAVVPNFVGDGEDEDLREHVRFTYQRFSDNLVTRSLLNKNLDRADPIASFQVGSVLHRLIKDSTTAYQNYGIIEALCVQLPESIGRELHEVAPYVMKYQVVHEAMIDSFIWRDASSFTEATREFINSELLTGRYVDDFVNALVTLAPTPGHPWNADRLHRILAPISMAERDSHWSIFLHSEWGQQRSVDRLVDWAWKHSDKHACDDEVVRLSATALVWFLTASNRELRDCATKGLVRLFKKRLSLLPTIIEQFLTIDEPYVSERLMAVSYGSAMRSSNDNDLAGLAQYVYDKYFRAGAPPVHLSTRDYARGVIEFALERGCGISVDTKLVRPPYTSTWPTAVEVPTRSEANKCSGFDFYREITSDFEDFSKYLTDFSEWSPRRLGESRKSNRENCVRRFSKSLTPRQKAEWAVLVEAQKKMLAADKSSHKWHDRATKEIEAAERVFVLAERKFMRMLGRHSAKQQTYVSLVAEYLRNPVLYKRMEWFDQWSARRWMVSRVIELGWTANRFGKFDNHFRGHRSVRSRQESIGKKYCWIALRELQARCADNFQLRTDYYDNQFNYVGPWDTGWGRDIDPSNLLSKTGKESYRNHTNTWWFPTTYSDWRNPADHLDWLKTVNDLPDPKPAMHVTCPVDGSKWLTLNSYYRWQQSTPPGERCFDVPVRSMWYMLKSYFVRNDDVECVMKWAAEKRWMNDWMPSSNDTHEVYLGEFFWADSYERYPAESPDRTDWTTRGRWTSMPAPLLIATDAYGWESTESDASLEDGISLELPCKFIVEHFGLRLGATEGHWNDESGNLVARDPCVEAVGPSALLIEQSKLDSLLRDHNLSIFWTLLGEKQLTGGDRDDYLGHLEINGAFQYRDGVIDGALRPTFFPPGTWKDPSVDMQEPIDLHVLGGFFDAVESENDSRE
jgi:hypothetical protein